MKKIVRKQYIVSQWLLIRNPYFIVLTKCIQYFNIAKINSTLIQLLIKEYNIIFFKSFVITVSYWL